MTKLKALYILAALALVNFGCKKEPMPEAVPADPVFYFSGNVGTESVKIEAGNNDYYMYSSYSRDPAGYNIYNAHLKQSTALPSGYSIAFLINDVNLSSENAAMNVDSAIRPGAYQLFDQSFFPSEQTLQFIPLKPEVPIETYSWIVKDAFNYVYTSSSYSLSRNFELGKTYSVSLHYDDGVGGCNITHTNVFVVGGLQTAITVQKKTQSLSYKFFSSSSFKAPFRYLWNFGDGNTSQDASPVHTYQNDGNYVASLLLINADNDTCYSYYQLNTPNNSFCHANYLAGFLPLNYGKVFKTITVVLTDPSGKVFSSANVPQSSVNFANIVEVSPFKINKDGNPTRLFKIRFNCIVANGALKIPISSAEAVVAVAYK